MGIKGKFFKLDAKEIEWEMNLLANFNHVYVREPIDNSRKKKVERKLRITKIIIRTKI